MKLITKAVGCVLNDHPLFSQCESSEPEVPVKFFTPTGPFTWNVLGAKEQPDRDWRFFGVMENGAVYLRGEFNLSEIEEFGDEYSRPFFQGLERNGCYEGHTFPLKEGMLQTWKNHAHRYPRQTEKQNMIPVMEGSWMS